MVHLYLFSDYVHNLILQFLGTLSDGNTIIRSTTWKILKLVKLPNIELFRLFVDGLIGSLEKHPQVCFVGPSVSIYVCVLVNFFFILLLLWLIHITSFQDEADIFSALFHIGRNHGKFVVSIINEVSEEVSMLLLDNHEI